MKKLGEKPTMKNNINKTLPVIAVALLVILSTLANAVNPIVLAQETATTTPSTGVNASKAVNVTEIVIVKARVLKDMLNKSMYLNISDELKNKIEELLNIDLSTLGIEELREWIHDATKVLASVSSELKMGKAFRVGIVLQRYLNGLREALMNRIRALANKYNLSVEELKEKIEEVLTNTTNASDINKLSRQLLERLRNIETIMVKEFAEKAKEYNYRYTERVRGGEAKGLDVAIKHIREAIKILNRTLEKLKNVNASPQAIETIENIIERLKIVEEVLEGVVEEIGETVKPEVQKVGEAFNATLKMLICRANHSINELLEEVKSLRERAANFSDILSKIDELEVQLLGLMEKLRNVEYVSEVKEILDTVSEVRLKVMQLCRQVNVLTNEYSKKINEKIKEITYNLIKEAEKKLGEVKDLYSKVKKEVESIVCIQIFPPPPKCVIVENIKKMLPFIEKQINEAEQDLSDAKKSFDQQDYAKAMANAQRALAKIIAAENQLSSLERMLKTAEKEPGQQGGNR